MKLESRRSLLAVALIACLSAAAPATADAPTVNVVSPTGVVYVGSFPASVPVIFTVTHAGGLNNLNVLDINVPTPTTAPAHINGNPFSDTACNAQVFTAGFTSCSVNLTTATLGFVWGNIPGPGDYTLQMDIKHQGSTGYGEETVTIMGLVSVEYPAPPAIANAYINANYKKIKPTARGCVISAIAGHHAHESKYGPKGGPYDNALVNSDVEFYRPICN